MRPGVFEMRASARRPVSALTRLDLPTLERPAKAISGRAGAGRPSGPATPATKRQGRANSRRPASSAAARASAFSGAGASAGPGSSIRRRRRTCPGMIPVPPLRFPLSQRRRPRRSVAAPRPLAPHRRTLRPECRPRRRHEWRRVPPCAGDAISGALPRPQVREWAGEHPRRGDPETRLEALHEARGPGGGGRLLAPARALLPLLAGQGLPPGDPCALSGGALDRRGTGTRRLAPCFALPLGAGAGSALGASLLTAGGFCTPGAC